MADINVIRKDRDGWAFGVSNTFGELFLGVVDSENNIIGNGQHGCVWQKDTPENRAQLESLWKANSFAREIKETKGR